MKLKANIGDRIVLNNWSPKYLRERYGTKTGVVQVVSTVYGRYDLNSRAGYLIRFPTGVELLWSYEFNVFK